MVKVALTILKKEGLTRVTMRRIATALETGPASLYVYVRDTQDLHAQILDALLGDLPAPAPGPHWRADLTRVTEAYLAVLTRYPAIARMTLSTHTAGPNSLRLVDTLAGLLLAGGASVRAAAWGVDLVNSYVVATAIEHDQRQTGQDLGIDELRRVMTTLDAAKHPHLARLGDEFFSGEGLERFRWGLEVMVRGIVSPAGS